MSSRRTHTKSRNGCRECKRRKVKCDESAPCCFNCARHGVVCSLGSRDVGDGIIPCSTYMNGFMPNLEYLTTNVSPTVAFSNLTNLIDIGRVSATATSTTNPEQEGHAFELTHHYCNYTADSVAFGNEMKQVWKVHVPELGYRCRYVMHGLMALAALHKAALLPSQRETYLDLAAYYQTLGLQRFLTELNRISEDSWQQAFCFASTVVMYALCSPALRKNDRLSSPLETTTDMLTFSRGLRAIVDPNNGRLATTKFRPLVTGIFIVDEKDPSFKHPRLETSTLPMDVFEALDKLRNFVDDRVPLIRRDSYKTAVDEMARAGYLIAHAGMEPELGMIMFWAFVAPDSVMSDIQSADPYGLVLLAHFAVFFAVLESRFWFLKNWPKLMFRAVDENLVDEDGTFAKALAWPRRQIFETYASNNLG